MSAVAKRTYEEYWAVERPGPLDDPFTARRLELLRAWLAESGARRVLDAGCGHGALVAALTGDGFEATGIDVAAGALARAERPELLFRHSVEELPWPVEPGSQDAVVSFEVIEHVLRPDLLLAGARTALSDGGRLALSTPYHGRAKNVLLAVRGFERHFDPTGEHVRFFTDRSLRRLLEREGFAVEDVCHLGRVRPLWANTVVWARKR
jgi:2-polyprenyl-3-methyl-5-hydroxy-6-metoxy-1,4-benzoquinol methylase